MGLTAVDPQQALPLGGHIVDCSNPVMPTASQGYVTSACFSPTLNRAIGLGMINNARQRIGEQVYVYARGKTVAATLVSPTHFDAKGEQLNG